MLTTPTIPDELPDLVPPPDASVVGTPERRPGSVRRTANINMVWPGGSRDTNMVLRGRCRDLLTPVDGDPLVLGEADMVVELGGARTIEAITVSGDREATGLIGAQGGGRLRTAIDDALPGEREAATPLHFLLDDIAGASLIGGFAWSQVPGTYDNAARPPQIRPGGAVPAEPQQFGMRKGRIICSGLRPEGYSVVMIRKGKFQSHFLRTAGDLDGSDDPWAWHEIEPAPEVCLRRRRRVDVWIEDGDIKVDAHFRDSVWGPAHEEIALHEYTLQVTVDGATRTVKEIAAQPRVLPFPECPWAAPHVADVIGLRVDTFRTSVQDTLTELNCCTHLNDMLRCLAEVSALADHIDQR